MTSPSAEGRLCTVNGCLSCGASPDANAVLGRQIELLAFFDLIGLIPRVKIARDPSPLDRGRMRIGRSEEHTSELQSLMRISYAVFCLKKKKSSNTPQKKIDEQSNNKKSNNCKTTTQDMKVTNIQNGQIVT